MRQVVYVTGPPCSGKSTYVANHRRLNDIVWDHDAILHAMMPTAGAPARRDALPCLMAMREAFLRHAVSRANRLDAWFITSRYEPTEIAWVERHGCGVVILATSLEECLRRLSKRERSGDDERSISDAVTRWHRAHDAHRGKEQS